jgi:hypothetical protein
MAHFVDCSGRANLRLSRARKLTAATVLPQFVRNWPAEEQNRAAGAESH